MTHYFVDTEFIEDGKTIDLISIGVVSEDGRELYLQSVAFDESKASPWVQEHVLPHLLLCPCCGHKVNHEGKCRSKRCPWRTREQLKSEILAFMDGERYEKPELWAWCGAYDFVAFCQIFGTMMDLPQGYPHYICDFQYVLDGRHLSDDQLPKQENGLHNALEDARHLKKLWECVVINNAWK